MPSKPVFISHAAANKQIADTLVDLLETGVGISSTDIFCSSLESMGVPSGVNFVDFIRGQIEQPRVVILLLSEGYYASQFCLCELGAAWAMSHRIVPLIIPPLKYVDVKAVLTGVQVLKIQDSDDLNQMQEELVEALGITGKPFARWEKQREKFLADLDPLIKAQASLPYVTADEYAHMRKKYEEAAFEVGRLSDGLDAKDELIEQLRDVRSPMEAEQLIAASRGDLENFEMAVERAGDVLDALPSIVQEAVFYHFRGEYIPWNEPFDDDGRAQIAQALEADYLIEQESGLELVRDDPKVAAALDAIAQLSELVDGLATDQDFLRYYRENYDHRLNFTSRRFWDTHLF